MVITPITAEEMKARAEATQRLIDQTFNSNLDKDGLQFGSGLTGATEDFKSSGAGSVTTSGSDQSKIDSLLAQYEGSVPTDEIAATVNSYNNKTGSTYSYTPSTFGIQYDINKLKGQMNMLATTGGSPDQIAARNERIKAMQDQIAELEGQRDTGRALTADELVDKALLEGYANNIQQHDWWSNNPNKQDAYNKIQSIVKDQNALVDYVVSRGITNLQNYDWWNAHPFKQQAWDAMEKYRTGGAQYGTQPATPTTPGMQDITGDIGAAHDIINNDPNIPDDLKPLFNEVVDNWDVNQQLNLDNVLAEFRRIQKDTIDPFYANQVEQFTNDLQRTIDYMTTEREQELETERTLAGQNIRQAKSDLEQRGMTFSGEGVKALGGESAFARPGEESKIPNQQAAAGQLVAGATYVPFGGGAFHEGTVNQYNRLMSSSSSVRHQKNLEALSRQAEQYLGSAGLSGLNIPGLPSGQGDVQQGTLDYQKQQDLAGLAGNLYTLGQQDKAYQDPINIF